MALGWVTPTTSGIFRDASPIVPMVLHTTVVAARRPSTGTTPTTDGSSRVAVQRVDGLPLQAIAASGCPPRCCASISAVVSRSVFASRHSVVPSTWRRPCCPAS